MKFITKLLSLSKSSTTRIAFIVRKSLLVLSPNSKRIKNVLDQINQAAKITIQIDYREPLYEKSINRTDETPYSIIRTIETSDMFEAITEALNLYFSDESENGVSWQSEIVGLKILFNLNEKDVYNK